MKQSKKMILNLGCGKTRIPGSIGLDRVPLEGFVDTVHDLDTVPYPYKDNTFDEIHMYHVIEHLHDPIKKIEEVHRILKPGGTLFLRAPHFSSLGAFTDMTHIRPFGITSFDCFEPGGDHHYYTTVSFKIIEKKIKYFGLYPNTGVYEKFIHSNQCVWFAKPVVLAVNFLISLSPVLFERIWCYWVGGAMEIVITMQKIES